MIRLGIIGAGAIVPYHIEAAKLAGFEPIAICGRENSTRAQRLSADSPKMKYCQSVEELLKVDLDAILIASSPEASVSLLKRCLVKNIPILVEKPVTFSISEIAELEKLDTSRVLVGYNRRHYSSVIDFKSRIQSIDFGLIQVSIPELSWDPEPKLETREKFLFDNSTHILDLVPYIFGPIEVVSNEKLFDKFGSKYCVATFRAGEKFLGTISLGYGTPENFSIKCWSSGLNIELNPIELLNECEELEIISATPLRPIKEYKKKFLTHWKIDESDLKAKPGFFKQFQELKSLVTNIDFDRRSATLLDAKNALLLASTLR